MYLSGVELKIFYCFHESINKKKKAPLLNLKKEKHHYSRSAICLARYHIMKGTIIYHN